MAVHSKIQNYSQHATGEEEGEWDHNPWLALNTHPHTKHTTLHIKRENFSLKSLSFHVGLTYNENKQNAWMNSHK